MAANIYLAPNPCKRGHVPHSRYYSTGQCVACAAAYQNAAKQRRLMRAAEHPGMVRHTVELLDPEHRAMVDQYVASLNTWAMQQRAISAGMTIGADGRVNVPLIVDVPCAGR